MRYGLRSLLKSGESSQCRTPQATCSRIEASRDCRQVKWRRIIRNPCRSSSAVHELVGNRELLEPTVFHRAAPTPRVATLVIVIGPLPNRSSTIAARTSQSRSFPDRPIRSKKHLHGRSSGSQCPPERFKSWNLYFPGNEIHFDVGKASCFHLVLEVCRIREAEHGRWRRGRRQVGKRFPHPFQEKPLARFGNNIKARLHAAASTLLSSTSRA